MVIILHLATPLYTVIRTGIPNEQLQCSIFVLIISKISTADSITSTSSEMMYFLSDHFNTEMLESLQNFRKS